MSHKNHDVFHLNYAVKSMTNYEITMSKQESPIIVVPNKHDPNQICLCVDMHQANRAIEHIHHPFLTTDDIIYDVNESKYFCKLGMNSAFQFKQEESSRNITTFATHQGLHRCAFWGYISFRRISTKIIRNSVRL